jgi:ATP-dependent DNA helicase PIF1
MIDIFEKRLIEPMEEVQPTRIFPTNNKVNSINENEYDSLKGEEKEYECKAVVEFTIPPGDTEKINKEIENMKKNLAFWENLPLKVGTQVMLIVNLDLANGLVNGSRGVVLQLLQDMVLVKFYNGVEEYITYHEWEHDEIEGLKIKAIPLIHAWATSIHKAQGISIDSLQIDIGNSVFEYGQAYVALSRVRTLEGLYILSMNPSKIKAHPEVISFYDSLRDKQTE